MWKLGENYPLKLDFSVAAGSYFFWGNGKSYDLSLILDPAYHG